MKKILFVSTNHDLSVGSYRIWVNDLNEYFSHVGVSSDIYRKGMNIQDYDVLICSKNDVAAAVDLKQRFPDKKVGLINLAADKKNLPIDFVIVGSLEEKDSLAHYKNVFMFPLIENMYQAEEDYKKHEKKDVLRIGYHGSYTHLAKFDPFLKEALEDMEKQCNIELLVVTSPASFNWQLGRPNIKNVIMKNWNIATIKEDLLSCDIGIVPNITHIPFNLSTHETSVESGLYNTDYIIRMKNKSNAGRAFVFHQLGIPVVGDNTPSNYHILGDPKCGFIAHTKQGWLKALLSLRDHETRQSMADNAKTAFDALYDPIDWSRRLYSNILRTYKEK